MAGGIWYKQLVFAFLACAIAFFMGHFFVHGITEYSVRLAVRTSARFSALVFALAFSASAIQYFYKNSFTFWLRQNRRFLGISFALLFFIHFCFLILLQQTFHPVFNRAATISLIGGGLAYVFAFLMFLTSFPYFSKKISRKNWLILHTTGSWWIWYIFIRSYVKRVIEGNFNYIPLLLLFVALLVLRLLHLIFKKKKLSRPKL